MKKKQKKPPNARMAKTFRTRVKDWNLRMVHLFGSTMWGRRLARRGLQALGASFLALSLYDLVIDALVWKDFLKRLSIVLAIFIASFLPVLLGASCLYAARALEQKAQYRFYAVVALAGIFIVLIVGILMHGFVGFADLMLDEFNIIGWGCTGFSRHFIHLHGSE